MSSLEFFFEDIKPLKIKKKALWERIHFLISNEGKIPGNISVVFCSDNYLLNINEQYLNHDYYTDIVTFDYVENSVISGDLCISVDRILENAEKFKTTFNKELYRVIFHGILHLTGYKDKSDEEKSVMRKKEDFYLRGFDFSEVGL